jgi:hypothetical protein
MIYTRLYYPVKLQSQLSQSIFLPTKETEKRPNTTKANERHIRANLTQ